MFSRNDERRLEELRARRSMQMTDDEAEELLKLETKYDAFIAEGLKRLEKGPANSVLRDRLSFLSFTAFACLSLWNAAIGGWVVNNITTTPIQTGQYVGALQCSSGLLGLIASAVWFSFTRARVGTLLLAIGMNLVCASYVVSATTDGKWQPILLQALGGNTVASICSFRLLFYATRQLRPTMSSS